MSWLDSYRRPFGYHDGGNMAVVERDGSWGLYARQDHDKPVSKNPRAAEAMSHWKLSNMKAHKSNG